MRKRANSYSIKSNDLSTSLGSYSYDSTYATGNFYIYRFGKLRVITGGIIPKNASATWQTLFALSENDRPARETVGPLGGYGMAGTAELVLRTSGSVQLNTANASLSATMKFNMAYLVA